MREPGQKVGDQYALTKRLGAGALGETWHARYTPNDADVAIRFIRPRWSVSKRALQAFFNDVSSIARLEHPALERIYDIVNSGNETYVIHEMLHAETLEEFLVREKRLSIGHVLTLGKLLAQGLALVHEQGVIHQRIEPANVLLHVELDKVAPKLVEFGTARLAEPRDPSQGAPGEPLVPLPYLSPEQIYRDVDVDDRTDVYSLAVLLHRCITGREPFDAVSPGALLQQIDEGSKLEQHLPPIDPKLIRLVSECLQRNRRMRPSMRVMADRLEDLAQKRGSDWNSLRYKLKVEGAVVVDDPDRTIKTKFRPWEKQQMESVAAESEELMEGTSRLPAPPLLPHIDSPGARLRYGVLLAVGGVLLVLATVWIMVRVLENDRGEVTAAPTASVSTASTAMPTAIPSTIVSSPLVTTTQFAPPTAPIPAPATTATTQESTVKPVKLQPLSTSTTVPVAPPPATHHPPHTGNFGNPGF